MRAHRKYQATFGKFEASAMAPASKPWLSIAWRERARHHAIGFVRLLGGRIVADLRRYGCPGHCRRGRSMAHVVAGLGKSMELAPASTCRASDGGGHEADRPHCRVLMRTREPIRCTVLERSQVRRTVPSTASPMTSSSESICASMVSGRPHTRQGANQSKPAPTF